MIPACHYEIVDDLDEKDLSCFALLVLTAAALWIGGYWLAFH